MLDTETKRRIDTARDILVGKVPDPKSQVEQITIALIYKFMDDMDAESEEFGGERKFFVGDFKKYGWAKLMRSGLSGHEVLNLYAEAITRMPENPGIPLLFRDIFKNAYLPYRDPETLRSFLKIIDEFNYDHSENLGNAYEYLLQVMGSQGDAGQFRTPRHIIDFMVEIVDPKKNETVLDPACGTAGFLISSYKHILNSNKDAKGNSTLSPDEKGRLAQNFRGYDISPDMVRLSQVNLYLHGFADPHISEYDTLTSLERWNEYADVILANPPFMSPHGGIKPHNRFSVQSKRSEVLFVDYMTEHLTANGRAGIIVPEGIIFQSGTAYKQLRKMLVETSLVAVISLPAGVFNPYSGVKTSILILDRSLAKKSNTIGFFKIENDGFGLGAQRRAININDLPLVLAEILDYFGRLRSGNLFTEFLSTKGQIVKKEKILANSEFNLSAERFRENKIYIELKYPLVPIGSLCFIERGASPRPIQDYITNSNDGINWIKIGDAEVGSKYITRTKEKITFDGAKKSRRVKPGDFILSNSMSFGRPYILRIEGCIHDGWLLLRDFSANLDQDYLYLILVSKPIIKQFKNSATGGVVNNLNSEIVRRVNIPLPPMDIQKEIVAEIEGYQKIIDGARAIIENYRPHIPINPDWPLVELGEVCHDILSGGTPPTKIEDYWNGSIPWMTSADIIDSKTIAIRKHITQDGLINSATNLIPKNNIIVVTRVGLGKVVMNKFDVCISQDSQGLIINNDLVLPEFLLYMLAEKVLVFKERSQGTTIQGVTKNTLKSLEISIPSLDIQQTIVTEIESEQVLVAANRELIERFERKIQSTLARIWGEN